MITYSGIRIEPASRFPGFENSPTLVDIVMGLGRMPRFAGQTRRWWSGLQHSIVCVSIAESLQYNNRVQLLCLMHDAHEAVTGDVPAFFKPKEMSVYQAEIDERLFTQLGLWPISEEEEDAIKVVDTLALRAEAAVLGPPTIMHHLADPKEADVQFVREVLEILPSPLDTDGPNSKGARLFLELFSQLIGSAVLNRRDDTPAGEQAKADSPYAD